jgi:hypothetical protein
MGNEYPLLTKTVKTPKHKNANNGNLTKCIKEIRIRNFRFAAIVLTIATKVLVSKAAIAAPSAPIRGIRK